MTGSAASGPFPVEPSTSCTVATSIRRTDSGCAATALLPVATAKRAPSGLRPRSPTTRPCQARSALALATSDHLLAGENPRERDHARLELGDAEGSSVAGNGAEVLATVPQRRPLRAHASERAGLYGCYLRTGAEVVRRLRYGLDLVTFFTPARRRRAWPPRNGQTALDAAGAIHSDIARGFIRCEVVNWHDPVEAGSHAEAARRVGSVSRASLTSSATATY
jgi:hypothetical protein